MSYYQYRSTAWSYQQILNDLIGRGHIVKVGDDLTQEFSPWLAVFKNPRERLIDPPGRNLNFAYCIAEAMDILANDNPGTAIRYNKNLKNWLNEDGVFPGHYGERIDACTEGDNSPKQLWRCYQELSVRPTSRRATITIHNPLLEDYHSKDVACTMDLQFLIRNNKLQCMVHMRSNDALWGFCYDTWLFQFIQESLAAILGVGLGNYYHIVGSFHYYDQRHKRVAKIAACEEHFEPAPPLLIRQGIRWDTWVHHIKLLHAICDLSPRLTDLDNMVETAADIFKSNHHFVGLAMAVIAEAARKKKDTDTIRRALDLLPKANSDIGQWIRRRCKIE